MIAKVCNRDGNRRTGFAEITEYIGHESKALAIRAPSEVFSLGTVAQEMELVAGYSHRVGNPMYHYVLSWPASDRVTHEQIFSSVERSIQKLGATGYMWVAAIHGDSDFAHVHVILNRVHPETKKALGVYRSYLKLSEFCREQERTNNWAIGTGLHIADSPNGMSARRDRAGLSQAIDSRAVDGEIWTGHMSFQRWVGGEPAAAARTALATGPQTWETVHAALAPFGLRYELYGRGATVVDAVGTRHSKNGRAIRGHVAKASHLGNEFSLRALERQLGPYLQNQRSYEATRALTYEDMRSAGKLRSEVVRDPRIAPLFAQYETEVQTWREDSQHRAARRAERWAEHRRNAAARWNRFREERKRTMLAIQGPSQIQKPYLRAVAHFLLDEERKVLVATNRAERAAIFSEKGPPSLFRAWLKERALAGDAEALAATRLLRIGIERERTQKKALSNEISGGFERDETFDRVPIRNDYMELLNRTSRDAEPKDADNGHRDSSRKGVDSLEFYREWYQGYIGARVTPKVLWQKQFERERDREVQLLRKFKTQLAQLDSERSAQELNAESSRLAMKVVLMRLQLHRTFEIEREMMSEVLAYNRIPSFREFLEYYATSDPAAKRLLPALGPDVQANFFVEAQDVSRRELLRFDTRKVSYEASDDGTVTYTLATNGKQFQDRGTRLDFEKVDRETIRLGLLIAKEKWLDGIVLTGTDAFKEVVLREAVQLDITITNPELQVARDGLVRERARERTESQTAWLDKEFEREQSPVTIHHSYDAQLEAYLGAIEDAALTTARKMGLTTSKRLERTNYASGIVQATWTFGQQGFVLVENEQKAELLITTTDHARTLSQQIGKHVDGLEREYKREQTHERDYSYERNRSDEYSGGLSL